MLKAAKVRFQELDTLSAGGGSRTYFLTPTGEDNRRGAGEHITAHTPVDPRGVGGLNAAVLQYKQSLLQVAIPAQGAGGLE